MNFAKQFTVQHKVIHTQSYCIWAVGRDENCFAMKSIFRKRLKHIIHRYIEEDEECQDDTVENV